MKPEAIITPPATVGAGVTSTPVPAVTFKLSSAEFRIPKIRVDNNTLRAHEKILQSNLARYHMPHTSIKTYAALKGSSTVNIDNLFLNEVPNALLIGMVESESVSGNYKKNCFNFQHFDADTMAVYVDGVQHPPQGYKFNCADEKFLPAMIDLYDLCGKLYNDESNGITRTNYLKGRFLVGFDLTKDSSASTDYFTPSRNGSLRLDIKFKTALAENTTIYMIGVSNQTMFIDKNRNIAFTSLQ